MHLYPCVTTCTHTVTGIGRYQHVPTRIGAQQGTPGTSGRNGHRHPEQDRPDPGVVKRAREGVGESPHKSTIFPVIYVTLSMVGNTNDPGVPRVLTTLPNRYKSCWPQLVPETPFGHRIYSGRTFYARADPSRTRC